LRQQRQQVPDLAGEVQRAIAVMQIHTAAPELIARQQALLPQRIPDQQHEVSAQAPQQPLSPAPVAGGQQLLDRERR